jgi:putative transposase
MEENNKNNKVKKYGKHPVSTDGGTWYPQACKFLNMNHHLHSFYEKRMIERTIQYIKDRTESFDDYFSL